jgi:BA14K-like protein
MFFKISFEPLRGPPRLTDMGRMSRSRKVQRSTRMSVTKNISLALLAGSLAFGTMGASTQANAKSLTPVEAAILAGAGGFVLGAIAGSHHHGHVVYVNSWDAHVRRCYAHYSTYDEYSDTYISHAGYEKRCRL